MIYLYSKSDFPIAILLVYQMVEFGVNVLFEANAIDFCSKEFLARDEKDLENRNVPGMI